MGDGNYCFHCVPSLMLTTHQSSRPRHRENCPLKAVQDNVLRLNTSVSRCPVEIWGGNHCHQQMNGLHFGINLKAMLPSWQAQNLLDVKCYDLRLSFHSQMGF